MLVPALYGRLFVRGTTPARPRPLAERVLLAVVVACIGIAVLRASFAVATVPAAVLANRRDVATVRAGGTPESTETVMERVAHDPTFRSWWGHRRTPYRSGGDYLGVISHSSATRGVGVLIGVTVAMDRSNGVPIKSVSVPVDRDLLYGMASGTQVVLANGKISRTVWGTLQRDAECFTDVPLVDKSYNPVLTTEQAQRVAAEAGLTKRSRDFFVGTAAPGQTGEWIILVRTGARREYLLVPVEYSPAGGSL